MRVQGLNAILGSVDLRSFVRSFPPFDAQDDASFARVIDAMQIEFFAAGSDIPLQSANGKAYAYMVRTGSLDLFEDGRLVDVLYPGEVFGYPSPSLSPSSAPGTSMLARAHEDTLCCLVPTDVLRETFDARPGLTFLSASLRDRTALAVVEASDVEKFDPWRRPMEHLVRRSLVECLPSTTIRRAAQLMAEERVSSLLVQTRQGWGIVTDRDLRTRVVAQGWSVDASVVDILTQPLVTATADTPTADGLRLMLECGIHHLPIERAGRIVGIVTDSDLMGLERRAPFRLRAEIERAQDRDDAIAAGRLLPSAVIDLVDARVDPVDIGHVVGITVDALTRRLVDLGIEHLGDAPVAYAWIALGSQARHEQSLRTDQDHALAFADTDWGPDVDAYFGRLAEWVTGGIEAVGIPRCRAGVSATEALWRASLQTWSARFAEWMTEAGPDEAALTAIAFDYRRVTGSLDVEEALNAVVRTAPGHSLFLRRLASKAVGLRPPTGFVRDFVVEARGEHAGTLDIKHGGLTAITSIARVLALLGGAHDVRTLDRLRHAPSLDLFGDSDLMGLEEAFRLLWQVRLEHQVGQSQRQETPDDHIDPKELGSVTRQGVKEAFRVVDRVQRTLALEFDLHPI